MDLGHENCLGIAELNILISLHQALSSDFPNYSFKFFNLIKNWGKTQNIIIEFLGLCLKFRFYRSLMHLKNFRDEIWI